MIIALVSLLYFSNNGLINLIKNNHTIDQTETYEFNIFKESIDKLDNGKKEILIVDSDVHHHVASYYYYDKANNHFTSHVLGSGYSKEDLINLYHNKYDYVYVWKYNQEFEYAWNQIIEEPIEENKLYKVNKEQLRIMY